MAGGVVQMRRRRRWPRRIAGVLGTAALLGSAAVIALMVLDAIEDEDTVPAAPASTPTAEPTKKNKERKPQLTAAQRRARSAAAAMLTREGFEPVSLADYKPQNTLRVLIGRPAVDDGGDRRAFFFVRREFIGFDADTPSAKLRVVRSGDRAITLGYRLYEPGNERCCPKGGHKRVRFRWNGEALTPQGEIPPAAERVPATGA
jgi:hypothetical protein